MCMTGSFACTVNLFAKRHVVTPLSPPALHVIRKTRIRIGKREITTHKKSDRYNH
jgi:hypothetical protein